MVTYDRLPTVGNSNRGDEMNLKPNPRITRHSQDQAINRGGCKSRGHADQWILQQYMTAKITYASKLHEGQIKIQNDDMVLVYDPRDHVIITVFISGHVKN